tara:strand:- start:437 stop:1120 length:684 start_codon:yes stop_codon:yes gene_type:complete
MKKNKIKLAIFDVNQTIFNLKEIEKRFKKNKIDPNLVDKWFNNVLKEGFSLSSTNSFFSFKDIAINELKRIVKKEKKNLKIVNYLFDGFKSLNANPKIKESFIKLNQNNIKVITLTNGPKENCLSLLKKNKLSDHIHECFSIEEIKTWKPDPKVYLYVSKKLNINPKNIIMIAAHGWDIFGAKSTGMKTGYISNYEFFLNSYYPKPDFLASNSLALVNKIINYSSST